MEELSFLEIQTTPTIKLVNLLTEAQNEQDQRLINLYALALAKRIYVPNASIPFQQVLDDFGYKIMGIEEQQKVYTKKRK